MTLHPHACPDHGTWRAWLDQQVFGPGLDDHLADCSTCQHAVRQLSGQRVEVVDALNALAPARMPSAAEIDAARARLERARREPVSIGQPLAVVDDRRRSWAVLARRLPTGWRVAASGLAAALILTLAITATPNGQAIASGFLAQFRSQSVTALELSPQSQADIARTLNSLSNYGTFQNGAGQTGAAALSRSASQNARQVSLAEASATVGFPLLTADPKTLPAGVSQTPTIRVTPATPIRFTFDKAKAVAYFASAGVAPVPIPDRFDGVTLVVSIPAAALLDYTNPSTHDTVVVGQSGELVVDVEGKGVSLDEMRDFLLGLPGLPPSVVQQLKAIKNWNDTLPIPVPVDKASWQKTTIAGNQGLLLNDNSGVGSAAIWHANGHLYGVAGTLKANQLQTLAAGLKAATP